MERIEQEINELVLSVRDDRNQDAMLELFKRLKPFRFSLAKKFSNKGIEFDDIVQQIDLKLIEAMYDYDESKDSSSLRHITSRARNGIWNYYRKEMNYFNESRSTVSLDATYKNMAHIDYDYHNLFLEEVQEFDDNAIVDRILLEEELSKLTSHQKEILFMSFIDDKTQYDIAQELNINQSNVSRTKKRGIKSIRESISSSDVLGENS